MMEIGKMIIFMAMEYIYYLMVGNMKATSLMEKCKVLENINGLMENHIKVISIG